MKRIADFIADAMGRHRMGMAAVAGCGLRRGRWHQIRLITGLVTVGANSLVATPSRQSVPGVALRGTWLIASVWVADSGGSKRLMPGFLMMVLTA